LESFPFSNYGRLLLSDETHFVYGEFGADAVDDTDKGIGDSDEDKKKVFVGTDRDNHEGKYEVDEVKNRESVSKNNPPNGGLVFARGLINFALGDFRLDLLPSKTA